MNLRRLANIAELSPSAVSLALRGSAKVSKATRERVQRLAKEHGYEIDARVASIMRELRRPREGRTRGCFGVMSLYDVPNPWEQSVHLRRIFSSMESRAREIGYRLEPFWLGAPGMTRRRFRGILDARGIEGLLCFGSPRLDDAFPGELDHFAVVTVGLSIRTPLHRVTSHFYNDTITALDRLHALGYRRPGLVIGKSEDLRTSHVHVAAYLGWCDRDLGAGGALPVLYVDQVEEAPLMTWLRTERPDALVFIHLSDRINDLRGVLAANHVRVPADVGLAVLSHILEGTGLSGMQQNQRLMGAWSVELLAARIANNDLGLPREPRIEMVESTWVKGDTLRARRPRTAG